MTETSVTLAYTATIHVKLAVPANTNLKLTTWGDTSKKDNAGNDQVATSLYEGIVPQGASDLTSVTYIPVDMTSTSGYVASIPVIAWITDDSANKNDANHDAEWEAAVKALTTNNGATVTYSYAGPSTSDNTHFDTNEVYFYTGAQVTVTSGYSKSDEKVSTANYSKQQLSVKTSQLLGTTDYMAENSALTIGYLNVRLEGKERIHTGTSYVATFTDAIATATVS